MKTKSTEFECVMKPAKRFKLKSKEVYVGATLYNLPTKALLITDDGSIFVAESDSRQDGTTHYVSLESIGPAKFTVFENYSRPKGRKII